MDVLKIYFYEKIQEKIHFYHFLLFFSIFLFLMSITPDFRHYAR